VNTQFVMPRLQRTLAAVYQFYDAFFFPLDVLTLPVTSPLEVSIPSLNWTAFRAESDSTYRFSANTLTRSTPSNSPSPPNPLFAVQVVATDGDYVSFQAINLVLPLPLSAPPKRSDFLIPKPLWPTTVVRPPDGETAVRGFIRSGTAQPVADLKVEMWLGGSPVPPPGTPFTRSNGAGDFLFRFPRLKGASGSSQAISIRLNGGTVPVLPATLPIVLGQTQIIKFQRM
jgi:hypothetical protein